MINITSLNIASCMTDVKRNAFLGKNSKYYMNDNHMFRQYRFRYILRINSITMLQLKNELQLVKGCFQIQNSVSTHKKFFIERELIYLSAKSIETSVLSFYCP